MDFTTAVKIIMRDLEETRTIIDDIISDSDIHATELDLVKARLRSATEMLSLLPRLAPSTTAKQVQKEIPVENKGSDNPDTVTSVTNVQAVEPAPQETEQASEPVLEIEDEIAPPEEIKTPEVPENREINKSPEHVSKPIFADRFTSEGILGEKISTSRSESDFAASISSKPVTDITVAIGLNDRFYYIRELFDNSAEVYSKTLSKLNKATSLGEAINILDKSIVSKPDADAYSSITDIIKRKFPVR